MTRDLPADYRSIGRRLARVARMVEGPYTHIGTREVDRPLEVVTYTIPNNRPDGGHTTHEVTPPIIIEPGTYEEYLHHGIEADQTVVIRVEGEELIVDPLIE